MKEREMGPIERELRETDVSDRIWAGGTSASAFHVIVGAADCLGVTLELALSGTADAEVLSEAIEAAEALGL